MALQKRIGQIGLILIAAWLALDLFSHLVAEILWFGEVGYVSVFRRRLVTQIILGLTGFSVTAAFLMANLRLTHRNRHPTRANAASESSIAYFAPLPPPKSYALGFRWLLFLVLISALVLGLALIYYGQVFIEYWHPDLTQPLVIPVPPNRFGIEALHNAFQKSGAIQLVGLLGTVFCLIVYPAITSRVIVLLLSLGFGLVLSSHWADVLQFLHPISFDQTENVFKLDISFYIFTLPIGYLLEFWLFGLTLVGFLSCTLCYLLSGGSLSQGRFIGFSQSQQRHLHGLSGLLMLSLGLSSWIGRYKLLYSQRGVVFGAGYTDIHVQSPAYIIICFISVAIALFLFWQAFFSVNSIRPYIDKALMRLGLMRPSSHLSGQAKLFADSYSLRAIFTWYLALAFVTIWAIPAAVQRFVVQPNELAQETPYIEQNIAFTQKAFSLDNIELQTFDPANELTYEDIQNNELTIRNIRLWDIRPLLQTNRQLQQIRPYYAFSDADVDRYTLLKQPEIRAGNSRTEKQQVLISARELDYRTVPAEAQTWINKHLVYTHGYGFTMSPVNTVAEGGLPEYFIREIGPSPRLEPDSLLEVSPEVQDSIPIGRPGIYYGELTRTNIMTETSVRELDYPLGNDNIYNIYDGEGGVVIGRGWKRFLFASYLHNWQMVFTRNFLPDTKLLFRRNILERVKTIAPFLRYDSDPYLVAADGNLIPQGPGNDSSYLYWILDAYTTSNRHPYSDPGETGLNYIRNSVKVVIDAFNGSVQFYYLETPEPDPIINSWRQIFPDLFKPVGQMPQPIRVHIRYPSDLFRFQSDRLLIYHMDDARVFYNREDQWRIPSEIYAGEQQPVEPYYLITKLPTETSEEFILLQPFTPVSRINLIAWFAGRSDGEQYGKLILYRFPKQRLVFGPEQVEALINQKPEISEQISLWNRQGSQVTQGNLLVIPIEQSLLYVEPLYLEASENSLPTLARVIVSYGNQIVMRETLEEAIEAVFEADPIGTDSAPAITPDLITPLQ
ncbi:MAG: UPF0182 family protein [Microcoleaceae cyanobacterium]